MGNESYSDKLFGQLGFQHLYEEQLEKTSLYRAIEELESGYAAEISYSAYQASLIERHNSKVDKSIVSKILRLFKKNYRLNIKSKEEFLGLNTILPQVANIRTNYGISRYLDISLPKNSYVRLNPTPVYVEVAVSNVEKLNVSVKVKISACEVDFDKLALCRIAFFNSSGTEFLDENSNLWHSKSVGVYKYFNYENGVFSFELPIPIEASYVRLGFQKWAAKEDVFVENSLNFNLPEPFAFDEQNADIDSAGLNAGVSIITASYRGLSTLPEMVESILGQSLERSLIELVVVVNGYDDGSVEYLNEIKSTYPDFNLVIKFIETGGASIARNLAIEIASRQYCVIIDDDDYIGVDYLKNMLVCAAPNKLVVAGIYDFKERESPIKDNSICNQVMAASDKDKSSYLDVNGAITMSACKLVPSEFMKALTFKENLKSGEDVVFFSDLVNRFQFEIEVIKPADTNVYYRRLKEGSISRRADSFEFLVDERLLVIKELTLLLGEGAKASGYVIGKVNAQSNFIKGYVDRVPLDKERAYEAIKFSGVGDYVFPFLNKNKAKGIVYSYCFPPYVDTAGVITAKRIHEYGQVVDVVCNKMDSIRDKSEELSWICNDLIESRVELATPTSFGDWRAIEKFALQGYEEIGSKKDYSYIYSRALWPASHFAGFVHKVNNPKTTWKAEFSDPSLWDINAEMRVAKVVDGPLKELIIKALAKKKIRLQNKHWNMYFLCEYLPYLFADELIFTCENQKKVMLEKFPLPKMAKIADKKGVVSAHPTLQSKFYNYSKSDYEVDASKINIAYFGAFYESRGLDELLNAISKLSDTHKTHVRVHVFTSNKDTLEKKLIDADMTGIVLVNDYLGYLAFLSCLKIFDYLFVNDSKATQFFGINPYLPSKYSDYKGSGVNVLAMCEKRSELDKLDIKGEKFYSSEDIYEFLEQLIKQGARNV